MAKRKSAGLLLYQKSSKGLLVFLIHHGGPFWADKDAGAWSIPKGEFTDDEEPLQAAKREFKEETGFSIDGNFIPLQPIVQKAGKIVYAWAVEGTVDADNIKSNHYKIQWPPKSGKWQSYPEVDKASWFDIPAAKEKINSAQVALLEELSLLL